MLAYASFAPVCTEQSVGIQEPEREMFKKILVANRGEIAMRIIRACRELNIATAAIYSEADSTGIYVKKADESYVVGPGPVKGFLDGRQIVELALRIGADAIHPGYGFLSENAEFAELCHASGITFIGPSPHAITLMGSKVKARELAESVGVPIVPGTEGGVSEATGRSGLRQQGRLSRHHQGQRRRRRSRTSGRAVGCGTAREHGGRLTGSPGGVRRRQRLSRKVY